MKTTILLIALGIGCAWGQTTNDGFILTNVPAAQLVEERFETTTNNYYHLWGVTYVTNKIESAETLYIRWLASEGKICKIFDHRWEENLNPSPWVYYHPSPVNEWKRRKCTMCNLRQEKQESWKDVK